MAVVSTLYYKSTKLERAIDRLFVEVDKAYRDGANILVLSTEAWMKTICRFRLCCCFCSTSAPCKDEKEYFSCYYPGIRRAERGSSFATLLGYGASAVTISGIGDNP